MNRRTLLKSITGMFAGLPFLARADPLPVVGDLIGGGKDVSELSRRSPVEELAKMALRYIERRVHGLSAVRNDGESECVAKPGDVIVHPSPPVKVAAGPYVGESSLGERQVLMEMFSVSIDEDDFKFIQPLDGPDEELRRQLNFLVDALNKKVEGAELVFFRTLPDYPEFIAVECGVARSSKLSVRCIRYYEQTRMTCGLVFQVVIGCLKKEKS